MGDPERQACVPNPPAELPRVEIVQHRRIDYVDGDYATCFVRIMRGGQLLYRGQSFEDLYRARMYADGVLAGLRVACVPRDFPYVFIAEVWELESA